MLKKTTKLIILSVLLLSIFTFSTLAQENNQEKKLTPDHQLNYKLPNNYESQRTRSDKYYNYQFTDKLSNKDNPSETIDIHYSSQTEYKKLDQEKYKEIETKKAFVDREKNQFYDINDNDNTRISFYLGNNQFLRCIETKYKQLNNNWFSILYNDQIFFLEQKEMILDYKLSEDQLVIRGGVFGLIKPLEKYSLCFKNNSDYAFDASKVDSKYMTGYLDDVYFGTKNLGQSNYLIKAKTTLEYIKTFEAKPDTIHSYDKIINSVNSNQQEEENKGELIEDQIQNNYEATTSQLNFKKDCFGDFYLASKEIKKPYFEKLILQDNKAEIVALTHTPKDLINYQIEYDTCHLWGLKKDTITKVGQIKIDNINLKINKKEISFVDNVIESKKIEDKNKQSIEIEKKILENGSRIYLTQEIFGKIEVNLEQYGPTKLYYNTISKPSKIRSLAVFTPTSLFNSIGTGFVDGLVSTKDTLIRPVSYFNNRSSSIVSFAKDIINIIGLFILFSLLTITILLFIICLIGISKIGLKNSKPLLRTTTVLILTTLIFTSFVFFANTFLDKHGNIKPDITNNYSNIIKSKICTPYGGYYDSSNNFVVNNYLYCLGNIGGIIGIIQDSDQLKEKYYY